MGFWYFSNDRTQCTLSVGKTRTGWGFGISVTTVHSVRYQSAKLGQGGVLVFQSRPYTVQCRLTVWKTRTEADVKVNYNRMFNKTAVMNEPTSHVHCALPAINSVLPVQDIVFVEYM